MDKITKLKFENDDSERLDIFLTKVFPDRTRSYFQKIISDGLVMVNGRVANKSLTLRKNDEIEVSFAEPPLPKGIARETKFEIVAEEKDFLVINKPAGLIVHHTSERYEDATLVDGLLYKFNEFAEFDEKDRPGIVHRLDRYTSGLIIVARNPKAQAELSKLFKDRKVDKKYLAVVSGYTDPKGSIDLPVGRHPTERTKMSHVSYAGRPARTVYESLEYYKKSHLNPECTLVSVGLETGRTHQIRVHFAAIGHGLLGDDVYGVRSKLIGRQALHSWKISFEFQGNHFEYTAPLPEDFEKLLSVLRESKIEKNPF